MVTTSTNIKLRYLVVLLISICFSLNAQDNFTELKGKVVDSDSKKSLAYVNLGITNSNIATVTNTEGEYALKVPSELLSSSVNVSLIGYTSRDIAISELQSNSIIRLTREVTALEVVSISAYKDAGNLVRQVFQKTPLNNQDKSVLMTAFYRETIKRRKRNVSLTEAVVDLYKQPYNNGFKDVVTLNKSRKSTDYRRLDTVAMKLQGGPFSTLFLDIMKYPEYIFSKEAIDDYKFTFDEPSVINNRPVYVVNFKLKEFLPNLGYYGKLYIDVKSLALVSSTYALDLKEINKAKNLLVKKKPRNFEVYPTKAKYRVDYVEKDGKWYYSYGNVDLTFKVNEKGKLFNSVYSLASEMAVTDWKVNTVAKLPKYKDRLRPSVIISDAVSGFSDPEFWGEFNLIEPDKSIESAIKKIQKKLKRSNNKT